MIFYAANSEAILSTFKRAIERDDVTHAAKLFEIKPESLESVRNYLGTLVQGTGVTFSEEAVAALHRPSGGWPFALNAVVSSLPTNVKRIELQHVRKALEEAKQGYPGQPFNDLD